MYKRGISGVVTAILLILLAIAAVIIVWSVVKPLIEKPAEGAQIDCVTVDLSITGVDTTAETATVKRETGAGDLTGITIRVVNATGDAKTAPCVLTHGDDNKGLNELESEICDLSSITGLGVWKTVEAYANVGAQKTLCPNFATYTVA